MLQNERSLVNLMVVRQIMNGPSAYQEIPIFL